MARKIPHETCNHASGPIKMQRIYVRQDSTFVPVGWMCPDCKQMQRDRTASYKRYNLLSQWF